MHNDMLIELLRRVGEGDHDAFTNLHNQTRPQLYVAAIKIVFRKALADEIVQEAFMQIWLNAAKFESGKAQALTWMISITRFRALDCLRYQKVRKEEPLTEFNLPQIVDQCPTVTHKNLTLRHKIDKLQSDQCDSIKLVYYIGLTHLEVANYMEEPLGTVKSWIRRSLQELRQTANQSHVS